jgi:Ca2+-transporting ATPase
VERWHRLGPAEVIGKLGTTTSSGLDAETIKQRQSQHGHNELVELGTRGPWKILWEQLSGAMVILLLVAALVSVYLREYTDAIVILIIVVLNTVLGFVQDYRAERALAALKKLAVPHVRVRRDGTLQEVSARELVPGDIVLLEVGNYVPADGRVFESTNLKVQEAALTGESEPILKQTEALPHDDLPLGDRTNMAYMGTVVTYGHGKLIITGTGMSTELGQIARSLQTVDAEPTPLQQRLAQLGRALALVALAIVAVVFVFGMLRGEDTKIMLMTALSLAVAVVPEGLPAVATVALALGARRMFHRQALIRKLPAVETLGSVTVICSDKTGTLTENRMTVTMLDIAGDKINLTETFQQGEPLTDEEVTDEVRSLRQRVAGNSTLTLLMTGAGLCNDAELELDREQHRYRAVGDPTEGALVVAGARLGLARSELQQFFPRSAEVPFDSVRKRMSTIHELHRETTAPNGLPAALTRLLAGSESYVVFTKGAVDSILDCCTTAWIDDGEVPMDEPMRTRIQRANETLAADGMRVLGVAFKRCDSIPEPVEDEAVETDLTFLGMLGMIDPPRPEVGEAVARCRTAGIRPLMITGDHPLTAKYVASLLDITRQEDVMTGQEVESLNDQELRESVEKVSVFARVAPKHKLRLVKALQENGEIVAMTGDGVNDAPALKQSHIGVAMGITGTDVSKEASQMVLLDDNFATIVNAVEQGRIVYDNIRKFVKYTMTSNAGEIWVMILGPILGMPLPLIPLQILWINLVTDGLPGLALAVEKAERNTMQRPPYPPDAHIFGAGMGRDIAWIGLLMGIVSLAMGYWMWGHSDVSSEHWRTIVFTTLTLAQMGNALATRSQRDSLFTIGVFSNLWLLGSVILTFVLQLLVIYWTPLQTVFKTDPLSFTELALCVTISSLVFWAVEAQKLVTRKWK